MRGDARPIEGALFGGCNHFPLNPCSLFGRGGFPGTIRLSRRGKSEAGEQNAAVQAGMAGVAGMSLDDRTQPQVRCYPPAAVRWERQLLLGSYPAS